MRKFLLLFITFLLVRVADVGAQDLQLNLPLGERLVCGQEVTIAVTANNFTEVNDITFQVEWDTDAFEYVDIIRGALPLLLADVAAVPSFVSTGSFGTPSDINSDVVLMEVTLRAISESNTPSNVFISDITNLGGTKINGDPLVILRDTATYEFSVTCPSTATPTISCPTQNAFTIAAGQTAALINDLSPTITNGSGTETIQYTIVLPDGTTVNGTGDASGQTLNLGSNTLTYLLLDATGMVIEQCVSTITLVEEVTVISTVMIPTTSIDAATSSVACVDINIGAVQDIADIQFAVTWDTSLVAHTTMGSATNPALAPGANLGFEDGLAIFSFVDFTTAGRDFTANENLFTVCFEPKGNGTSALSFTSTSGIGISFNQVAGGGLVNVTDQIGLTPGSITITNVEEETTPTPVPVAGGFTIGRGTATCGQVNPTCLEVTIGDFQRLSNIQFSLNWDPTVLQYASRIENTTLLDATSTTFGDAKVTDGILNFSWFDFGLSGQDFAANEVLFSVCYNPLVDGTASVVFSDNETPRKINQYDAALNQIEITEGLAFSDGSLQISNCATMPPPTTMPSTEGIALGTATASCGQTGPSCVDVTIGEFQDLANIQFSVNWDPTILQFASVTNNEEVISLNSSDYGDLRTDDGILNFSWFDFSLSGQDFDANEVLFTLCFNPLKDGDGTLTFSDNETPIKVNQYGAALEQTEITDALAFSNGGITVLDCGDGGGPMIGINGVSLTSTTATCSSGAQACVDILIAELADLSDIQFSVNWNPSILQFASVSNNDNLLNPATTQYGELRVADGILNFSWFDISLSGQDFDTNDLLFTLCFDPLQNGTTDLTITDTETPIKVNQYTTRSDLIDIAGDLTFSGSTITVSECIDMPPVSSLGVNIGGATIDCNQTTQETCVEVTIAEFQDLANVQFSVNWNAAVLALASIIRNDTLLNPSTTDFGEQRTSEGILNFSWFDISLSGQSFEDGDRLFTLCFLPIGQGDAQLRFTGNETPMKVNQYNANVEQEEITDGFAFNTGTLSVVDNQSPTVSNCSSTTIVVYTTADNCQATASWSEPTFADACNTVTVQQTNQLGELFSVGDQTVQYTGVDAAGNIATCSFVVSVRDTIAPTVMNCPNSITRDLSAATNCDNRITWIPPTAMDACSANPIITANFQSGDAFPIGASTVRYTVMDSSGNMNNDCAFTVEITGEAPVRLTGCPENIVNTFTPATGCELEVSWIPPVLVSGCSVGQADLSSNFEPGDRFPVGITTVTYTASDEGGNTDICSFDVSVTGSNPITFTNCPGNIRVNSLANQCGATVGWAQLDAVGGCGTINLVCNFSTNDFFPVGTSVVSCTATDATGDVETCTFTVEVVDDQSLVVLCPQDIVVDANGVVVNDPLGFITNSSFDACGSARLQYNDIEAFDNCSSSISRSLGCGLPSGSVFTDTTEMCVFVSNASGESVTCDFRIMVEAAPSFTASLSSPLVCTGQAVTLQATELSNATYTWSGPNGFISNERNPVIDNPTIFNSGDYTVVAIIPGGCTVSDLISIAVNEGVEVEATGTDLECGENTIDLVGTGANILTWVWTGPNEYEADEQNPIINNATSLQAGIYTLVGTGLNNCQATDTVEITYTTLTPPTVQAAGLLDPGIACEGQPITLKGTVYPGEVLYDWEVSNTGGGLPEEVNDSLIIATPTNVGEFTYNYTVDLGNGCVADTSIVIMVMPSPQYIASSNSPISCATVDNQLMLSAASDDASIVNWTWEGPNDFTRSFQNVSVREVSAAMTGEYVVTAFSENGCIATDTVSVEISDQPPVPSIEEDRITVCEGSAITIIPTEIDTNVTYSWTGPNDFMSDEPLLDISNALSDASGGYQLVQSANGCESNPATVLVSVLTEPEINGDEVSNLFNENADFEVISNDTLVPGAGFTISIIDNGEPVNDFNSEAGNIQSNGDGSFNYTPTQDWIGKLQFAYEICYEACPELCSMEIVTIDTDVPSDPCRIPSVLSPNGDDKNDALIISCNSDPPKGGGLLIFNQWGAKVYEAFPYSNDWNGTYQGEDLPDGVYYYVYSQTDNDTNPIKGCVTIFR